jgi:hypothetical protein
MDIKHAVGETAGKVWHLLNEQGPQSLAQIEKKLSVTGELVTLAIGWLAREEKVDISQEKRSLRVQLKQEKAG